MIGRFVTVVGFAVVAVMVAPTVLAPAVGAAPPPTVSVANLVTSSFSGTGSSTTASGCSGDFLTFAGSYPGKAPVGTVALNVAGCFDSDASSFSGSFTITTGVGTLSGNATGPENTTYESTGGPGITPVSDIFELTLGISAGTGSFAGTGGAVQTVLTTAYNNFATFGGTLSDFFTQILVPQAGTVSGVTYLDAAAYDAPGTAITKVVFETGGQVIGTAAPTAYGWIAKWNTTTSVASGFWDVVSVATDANGGTTTSFPVSVQVTNPVPTTAVLVPSSGATLSGSSVILDASASSPDGAPIASVKFTVTGGGLDQVVLGTATPTMYGYILKWNSTTVPNGSYVLNSLVTDVAGNYELSLGGISITVTNPPPTTAVIIPSPGASVSGTSTVLDATASANVTSVTFELSGGTLTDDVIATAVPTIYGWIAQWNTTTVPDGTYALQSVASYSRYFASSGTSAPLTITVAN